MFSKPADKKAFGTKPAASNAGDSRAVDQLIKDLIVTVAALRDVLTKENEALSHGRSQAFIALQDEKVAAARRYETLLTSLLSRNDLNNASPRLKQQLLSLEGDFTAVMKENMTRLERMKNATEKLGEWIMKSARKSAENMTQFAYGSAGTMQKGVKATIGVSEQA